MHKGAGEGKVRGQTRGRDHDDGGVNEEAGADKDEKGAYIKEDLELVDDQGKIEVAEDKNDDGNDQIGHVEALDEVVGLKAIDERNLATALLDHDVIDEDEDEGSEGQVAIEVAMFVVELDGLDDEVLLLHLLLLLAELLRAKRLGVDTCGGSCCC